MARALHASTSPIEGQVDRLAHMHSKTNDEQTPVRRSERVLVTYTKQLVLADIIEWLERDVIPWLTADLSATSQPEAFRV